MKLFISSFLFALVVSAFAGSESVRDPWNIDWSRVVPRSALDRDGNLIDPNYNLTQGLTGRIYNGQPVAPNSHSYAIALVVHFTSSLGINGKCQGSLINMRSVLTTARCIFGSDGSYVIAGAHDITITEPNQQRRFADQTSYLFHPGYSGSQSTTSLFNIAIIHIITPLSQNIFVRPIQLPSDTMLSDTFVNEMARFVGNKIKMYFLQLICF